MNPETINVIAGVITLTIIVGFNVVSMMRGQRATRAFVASTEAIATSTAAIPQTVGAHVGEQMKAQLAGFLDIYTASRDTFNQQLGEMRAQVVQYRDELRSHQEQAGRDRRQFEFDLAEQKKLTTSALSEVELLKAKVGVLEQIVTEKNQQHEIDLETIEDLRGQLELTKTHLNEAQNELTANRTAMEREINLLRERVTTLERQVKEMAAERDRLIQERDAALEQRAQAIKERDAVQAKLDKLQSEYDSLIASNTLRDAHMLRIEAELARIKATLPEAQPPVPTEGGAG